jgi:hypothetical protein
VPVTRMITETQWFPPLLWAALYVSDYSFTIACARLYQAQTTLVFEGSYEITPMFQGDVNALRRFSPRFAAILVASTAYVWWLASLRSSSGMHDLVAIAIGALVLIQLTVHLRHLRNWFMFRTLQRGGITGRIEYPRAGMLRTSAFELLTFTGLYGCLFAFTHDLFVLGGALACAVLAGSHYRLARRHESSRGLAGTALATVHPTRIP